MATVTKAYTTTIVAGLVANASNVRRALDDIYDEFNGGIDSANISANFSWPASQIVINDTAAQISATSVEDGFIEVLNVISGSVIQDFTQIKNVGQASQQFAGHRFTTTEPGTTSTELIALYNFDDSASKTIDEVGTYTLDVCNADVVSGIMGLSGGALLFTSSTNSFAFNAGLFNSFTSGFVIDCWIKPEQISAGSCVIFDKNNSAGNHRVFCNIDNTGDLTFSYVVGGTTYAAKAVNYFITGTGNNWTYIVCSQDSSNGVRLWVNSELVGIDISGTASLNSGSDSPFYIGASYTATAPYAGHVADFRVRQKVISQKDVDLGYASKYTLAREYADTDFSLKAILQKEGNEDFIQHTDLDEAEVVRQSATVYRDGSIFGSSDKLRIIGKVR